MVLAGVPRSVTDRLQRVLNAVAHLVSGTHKYDRGLTKLLHVDLHWLDVADRVQYTLAVTIHRCLHNKVPKYLTVCRLLHRCLGYCGSLATTLSILWPAGCATVSMFDSWPAGVLRCWTNCLELAS